MTTEIRVIYPIDTTHKGPVAPGPNGKEQRVHLRQGDIDGACGPYCLFTTLLICGVIKRAEATALKSGKDNGPFSNLLEELDRFPALFRKGTNIIDLTKIVKKHFKKNMAIDIKSDNDQIVQFIENHIKKDHPVLLGLKFKRNGHWVVVIGLEYLVKKPGKKELCRFLVLDPSDPTPKVSAWNGVIDARPVEKTTNTYEWWTAKNTKVKFDGAIAIWRKEF